MKNKIITSIIFALALGILNNVFGQIPGGDGIRARSAELERIRRQAQSDTAIQLRNGKVIDIGKVKRNFEGIQKLQDSIVECYTKGEKIDYRKINKSSGKMTKMAVSLRNTVFSTAGNQTMITPENTVGKDLRDLIISLDNAIGRFVASPMFRSEKVIDEEVFIKSLSDLEEIIDISRIIWLETDQLKNQ